MHMKRLLEKCLLNRMFLVVSYLYFTACDRRPMGQSEVIGTYVYRLSTGEVEVLSLEERGFFHHFLYPSGEAFNKGDNPLLSEAGSWSANGSYISIKMWAIFESDFASPKNRLIKPEETLYSKSGALWWRRPTSKEPAAIVRNEDVWYVMYKLINPTEIDVMKWQYPVGK